MFTVPSDNNSHPVLTPAGGNICGLIVRPLLIKLNFLTSVLAERKKFPELQGTRKT